jgi:NADH:ubiquinone oxidoreductase subunit F (NADH-binding)/(2Fe-2S) ferredoxin/NAD-dependent dihydropyrimidine dehydrogenase PreA subunit
MDTKIDFKKEKKITITVCRGSSCESLKSKNIIKNLNSEIKKQKIKNIDIQVKQTGCHGFCEAGPIVVIKPFEILYTHVKPEDAKEIISGILNNQLVQRLLYNENGKIVPKKWDLKFYKDQTRFLLRRCGEIDQYDMDEYLNSAGYEGLKKTVKMKPEEVVQTVLDSGLKGRGGAGFPTGMKWSFISKNPSENKYLVANADEGDPGSFMDRTLLEGDPFSVIEGMTIASYATGAKHGVIYVRAEYPHAVEILENALKLARKNKFLGKNICGKKGFDFDIKLVLGAGAFVCGEETALMNSVEGKRGMPRPKPPFPAQAGLWQNPTNINNVKSYAFVSHILRDGIEPFKKLGTKTSPGTAVLSLTGKINYTGVVEVPMGIPLKKLVFEVGGGVKNNKKLKAVMTGGPSGGVIPENMLELGVDYESLTSAGSIMGSGGVVIFDDSDNMAEVAKFFLGFTTDESCGKCVPCREGTYRLHELLDRVLTYRASESDLDFIKDLSLYIKDSAACGLGQTAPNPVLTTLKYFKKDYEAHLITEKYKEYFITPKCVGCHQCTTVCPQKCISGNPGEHHIIDQKKCVMCGACYNQCKFDAIIKNQEKDKDHELIKLRK